MVPKSSEINAATVFVATATPVISVLRYGITVFIIGVKAMVRLAFISFKDLANSSLPETAFATAERIPFSKTSTPAIKNTLFAADLSECVNLLSGFEVLSIVVLSLLNLDLTASTAFEPAERIVLKAPTSVVFMVLPANEATFFSFSIAVVPVFPQLLNVSSYSLSFV